MDKRALISNIQRYAIHDGPGIRTTIFLKGCPLRCQWCSNPEAIKPYHEITVRDLSCIKCWRCIESCPVGAITKRNESREIDRDKCNLCGECAEVCTTGAIELVGKYMSGEEVLREIEKDRLFYLNSGGGVTFSGGEPLDQAEFVVEVSRLCRQRGIHTTLDTTGYSPWPVLREVLNQTDLILYDIKHLDPVKHKEGTGTSNELILNNLQRTVEIVTTWLRIPIIPNFNDSELYIASLAAFIVKLPKGNIEKISLLPYHNWGEQKYERLGNRYAMTGIPASSEEHVYELKEIFDSYGLSVSVGS